MRPPVHQQLDVGTAMTNRSRVLTEYNKSPETKGFKISHLGRNST
jgi:hypothetical protein